MEKDLEFDGQKLKLRKISREDEWHTLHFFDDNWQLQFGRPDLPKLFQLDVAIDDSDPPHVMGICKDGLVLSNYTFLAINLTPAVIHDLMNATYLSGKNQAGETLMSAFLLELEDVTPEVYKLAVDTVTNFE